MKNKLTENEMLCAFFGFEVGMIVATLIAANYIINVYHCFGR